MTAFSSHDHNLLYCFHTKHKWSFNIKSFLFTMFRTMKRRRRRKKKQQTHSEEQFKTCLTFLLLITLINLVKGDNKAEHRLRWYFILHTQIDYLFQYRAFKIHRVNFTNPDPLSVLNSTTSFIHGWLKTTTNFLNTHTHTHTHTHTLCMYVCKYIVPFQLSEVQTLRWSICTRSIRLLTCEHKPTS